MKKFLKRVLLIILAVTIVSIGAGYYYIQDYYHADAEKVNEVYQDLESYDVYIQEDAVILEPENAKTGIIFYPGAKVEHTAYLPLFKKLADQGILCVVCKMPGNLAILDKNAADDYLEKYDMNHWYIAGHSLGGAMAASYLKDHQDHYDGLILLASYATNTIDIPVLSIYGSNDQVLSKESYEKNKGNIDQAATEVVIEGGNHSGFGNYGAQEGDGPQTVTKDEQQKITSDAILSFIKKVSR